MNDMQRMIDAASAHVQPSWDEARLRRVERALLRRRARARLVRTVGGVALAAAVLVVVGLGFRWKAWSEASVQGATVEPPAAAAEPAEVVFPDGSRAQVEDGASLRQREAEQHRVVAEVERGSVRFDVNPGARVFKVIAGQVAVQVLGTAFTVQRSEVGAHVAVDRGRVRVSWPDGSRELGAGEAGDFPPAPRAEVTIVDETATGPEPEIAPVRPRPAPQKPPVEPQWRDHAHRGDYAAAYAALEAQGPGVVRNHPDDLLLAADVARLSGHPAQAVGPLERVLRGHRGDGRASLAAFTLGKLLLDQLGRPAEAAGAFADARALAPGGALAQDALAREVEAWARAGQRDRARLAAEQYVQRYPDGQRAAHVRRLGGLE